MRPQLRQLAPHRGRARLTFGGGMPRQQQRGDDGFNLAPANGATTRVRRAPCYVMCPPRHDLRALVNNDADTSSTARGFEPLRAEPNGFGVHFLNRSETMSCWPCCGEAA